MFDYQTTRVQADPVESFARNALELAKGWANNLLTARMTGRFGPVTICVESCGRSITRLALEGLRHAREYARRSPDFRIIAADSREIGIAPCPAWSFPAAGAGAHRCRQRIDGGALEVGLNLEWRTWGILDRRQRLGLVWSADAAATPEWVIRDQTRNIIHWWSSGHEWGLFHAAALRLGSAGCLVAGKSGSGKSTLTAAAIAAGFSTAGDDFVLVETGIAPPRAHAVFQTIKLDEQSIDRVPKFRPHAFKAIEAPREKFLVRLFEVAPHRIASDFPLQAILHSRITGDPESRIVASSSARAFNSVAPSTIFELRSHEQEIVARAGSLVRALPAFSIEFGTDIDAAIGVLRDFMLDLAA